MNNNLKKIEEYEKEIQDNITYYTNEINKIENDMQQLESEKNNISEKEYNRYKEIDERFLKQANDIIEELKQRQRSIDGIRNNLKSINDLNNLPQEEINDNYQEINEEISRKQEEIKNFERNLPQNIINELENELHEQSNNITSLTDDQNDIPLLTKDDEILSLPDNQKDILALPNNQKNNNKLSRIKERIPDKIEIENNNGLNDRDIEIARLISLRNNYNNRIKKAEEQLKTATEEFMKVYNEERDTFINDGPFASNELNNLQDKFSKEKQEKDKNIQVALNNLNNSKMEYKLLNDKISNALRNNKVQSLPDNQKDILGLPDKQKDILGLPDKQKDILALPDKQKEIFALPDKHKTKKDNIEPKHTLDEIIDKILSDKNGKWIDISKKERKNIEKGKICVTKAMKTHVTNGNLLYNILGVTSALMTGAFQTISKIQGKVYTLFHKNKKKDYDAINNNLNNLSLDDLKTLEKELTSNRIQEREYIKPILPLINRKINEYQEVNENQSLRQELKNLELDLLTRWQEIRKLQELASKEVDSAKKQDLVNRYNYLINGSGNKVKKIWKLYEKLDNRINSSGEHARSEDLKASESNMNREGKFFSKRISTKEGEITGKILSETSSKIEKSILANDEYGVLKAYVEGEIAKKEATKVNDSITGKHAVGEYNYRPIPMRIDYRQDPLLRYITTTLSTCVIVKGIANEIHNRQLKNEIEEVNRSNKTINDKNNRINQDNIQANNKNQQQQNYVNQTGQELSSKSGVLREGVKQQNASNITGKRNMDEVADNDATNWSFNDVYHANDKIHHMEAANITQQFDQRTNSINQRLMNGQIDELQANAEYVQMAKDSWQTLTDTMNGAYSTMKSYMNAHPEHDYTALNEGMTTIINNPNAMNAMNEAMQRSIELGKSLESVQYEMYNQFDMMLKNAPSDICSMAYPLIMQTVMTMGLANSSSIYLNQQYGKEIENKLDEIIKQSKENKQVKTKDIEKMVDESYESNNTNDTSLSK